jgi:hypothetical protein
MHNQHAALVARRTASSQILRFSRRENRKGSSPDPGIHGDNYPPFDVVTVRPLFTF